MHRADKDAAEFGIRKAGGNRFDPLADPWRTTEVLYAGTSLEVAIAETILRWHGQIADGDPIVLSNAQLRERRVARIDPLVALDLIEASGLGLATLEQAVTEVVKSAPTSAALDPPPLADDIFQCGVEDYALTQRWGAWMRTQAPKADGITWVSRQFNRASCVVLFADRCKNVLLQSGASVPLLDGGDNERVLDELLGQLGWGRE